MNYTKLGILGAVLFTLTACGGSSSDSSGSKTSSSSSSVNSSAPSDSSSSISSSSAPSTDASLTGVFIDSAVANVSFKTAPGGKSGTTSANGEYDYIEGDTVTFSIGALTFPPVAAKGVVTPLDMATPNSTNPIAVNIAALLQSLDADGNPDNGIDIPAGAAEHAGEIDFDQPYSSFATLPAVVNLVANSGSTNTTVVSETAAKAHLEKSLGDLKSANLVGTWYIHNDYHYALTIIDSSRYAAIDYDPSAPGGVFEFGTYSWNQTDGKIVIEFNTRSDDTELDAMPPFADGNVMLLDGDKLTLTDADETFELTRLKATPTQQIIGGWLMDDDEALVVIAFTGANYLMGQYGEVDETGYPGIEFGTYVYTPATNELKVETLFDNNGQWGLSHPCAVLDLTEFNDLSCGPDGTDIKQTFTINGRTATYLSQADTIADGEENPADFQRVEEIIDGSIRLNLKLTLTVTEYKPGEHFEFIEDGVVKSTMQCGLGDDTDVGESEVEYEVWYLNRDPQKASSLGSISATFNPATGKITYNDSSSWAPVSCGDNNDDGKDDCAEFYRDKFTESVDLTYHPGQNPVVTGTYIEDRQLSWTLDGNISSCGATYSVTGTLR